MKNKWDQVTVNSQEDEDGFSLNPGSVFHYENPGRKRENNSTRDSVHTGTVSGKLVMISPGPGGRISQLLLSTPKNLQSQ